MLNVAVLLKIIGVSASGALAPGPLTASSVAVGTKEGWKGGLNIAFGHMIIEFPLVLAIAFGLGSFFQISFIRLTLGFVGGIFLLFFGFLTLKDALHVKAFSSPKASSKYNSSILIGVALTAFNPYFIAWWISVGTALLLESLTVITLPAIILFYLAHVWLDYFWLILMSKVGSFSKINLKFYKIILIALAIMILYFGIELLYKILLA
ncbi:MAG: LysE family transporter [Nitrososphaeria archaeon]